MVCLGLKTGVAEWKVYTNPLSYGGTQKVQHFNRLNSLQKDNAEG